MGDLREETSLLSVLKEILKHHLLSHLEILTVLHYLFIAIDSLVLDICCHEFNAMSNLCLFFLFLTVKHIEHHYGCLLYACYTLMFVLLTSTLSYFVAITHGKFLDNL